MFTAAILLPSYSGGAAGGRWQPEWGCSWVSNLWVLWGLFSHSSSYQHPCRRTLPACISLYKIHPFPCLGTMEGQIREWKELCTLVNRALQKCERKRGGKKSRLSWHLKLAHGVGHAPSLPCPAWGSTSRSGSPWWCSLACQILLSFQRVEKKHHQADSLSFFFSLDVGVEFWFLTPIPRNGWPHHLGEPAFSANLSWKDSPPTVPLPDTGPLAWASQRSAGALPEFGASLHTSPLPTLLRRMTHLDSVPCQPRWVAHLRGHDRVDWSTFTYSVR